MNTEVQVDVIPTHCLFTRKPCDGSCGECMWAECPDDPNDFEPMECDNAPIQES